MTCPTCKSSRCGNHAACARRDEAQRNASTERAAKGVIWIAEWTALWVTISMCNKTRRSLGGDGLRDAMILAILQPRAQVFFLEKFGEYLSIAKEMATAAIVRRAARGGA